MEYQAQPIPLCRFVFPTEIIAPYVFRENDEGIYLIKGCNTMQPTKKTDSILRQWRKVMGSLSHKSVGLTYDTDCEIFEGHYLINPKLIKTDKRYYPAAQLMKMCHWATQLTKPESIHILAKDWQKIL